MFEGSGKVGRVMTPAEKRTLTKLRKRIEELESDNRNLNYKIARAHNKLYPVEMLADALYGILDDRYVLRHEDQ